MDFARYICFGTAFTAFVAKVSAVTAFTAFVAKVSARPTLKVQNHSKLNQNTHDSQDEPLLDNFHQVRTNNAFENFIDPNRVPRSQSEQSLTATFVDISFKLSRGFDDSLLHRVTGKVSMDDGGIYAIMGPSGAGKTTLLDVIAGRKYHGKTGGTLVVNGVNYASMVSRRRSFGYVLQDDSTLPSFLTVKEAIRFSADLRLPAHISRLEKETKVMRVISQLGFCVNSLIGMVGLGISGGSGDVSIGMELVVEPKVLLLDDNDGLDASAALQVNVLTELKAPRVPCISTIHQPRPIFILHLADINVV